MKEEEAKKEVKKEVKPEFLSHPDTFSGDGFGCWLVGEPIRTFGNLRGYLGTLRRMTRAGVGLISAIVWITPKGQFKSGERYFPNVGLTQSEFAKQISFDFGEKADVWGNIGDRITVWAEYNGERNELVVPLDNSPSILESLMECLDRKAQVETK